MGVLVDGDQSWLLVSAALVQIMTPGVAFFYGGLVSESAVISTMMMSYGSMGIVTLLWSLIGYSLAFGKTTSTNVVGSDNLAVLNFPDQTRFIGVETTVSESAYMAFQLMFAVITAALISGSVVGRMKYWWWIAFVSFWHIFVYCVLAHWVFDYEGWMFKFGTLDFAGGLVVHIASGVSGFVLAFWLDFGRPKRARTHTSAHNVPYVLLGAALLWFGWFGFNAGSALAANMQAGRVFVNTQLAASAAMFTYGVLESIFNGDRGYFTGRPTAVGAATGAIIGLVGITPACAFVSSMWSIFIGFFTTLAVFGMPYVMRRTGVDDTLDACAIHGVGGMVGALLTGLFADVNANGLVDATLFSGGFFGNGMLFAKQIASILVAILYCAVWTTAIYWFLWAVAKYVFKTEMRIDEQSLHEPDMSQHGEKGYYRATKSVAGEVPVETDNKAALSLRSASVEVAPEVPV